MKRLSHLYLPAACAAAAASCGAFAAGNFDEEPETSGWFVRLGGRVSTGAKVSLLDNRGTASLAAGHYDNGFVLPDVSGDRSRTWNWGYNNNSQVSGDALTFNRLDFGTPSPRVSGQNNLSNSGQYGGELNVGFEFVRFDFRKRDARMGFELGYNFSQIKTSATASAKGTLVYTTDQYPLNGVLPPVIPASGTPYSGTFNGPGPLLGLTPSHNVVTAGATETVSSRLNADLHTFRFGPWVSLPFSSRLSLGVSGGYAVILTDPRWQISDAYTVDNPLVPAPPSSAGSYSHTHFLPGAFGQVRLEWRVTSRLGAYVGADIQYNTGLSVLAPGREARFNFGAQYGGVGGLSWSF